MAKQEPSPRPGKLKAVEVEDIQPGPILRSELDPLLALWARRLFDRVGLHVIPTFEQWELGFLRDAQPQSELFVWEAIARSFDAYCCVNPCCDKGTIASDLMLISMDAKGVKGNDDADLLESLYRAVWTRMVGDTDTVRREVFQSMASD